MNVPREFNLRRWPKWLRKNIAIASISIGMQYRHAWGIRLALLGVHLSIETTADYVLEISLAAHAWTGKWKSWSWGKR